jgi:ATP-dependent Clp protease ATP-binding subunit ClpX
MEDVDLTFTDEALSAIAKLALERKTGARGLRSIVEDILLDTMFKLPSDKDITAVEITEDTVKLKTEPNLIKGTKVAKVKKTPVLQSLAS